MSIEMRSNKGINQKREKTTESDFSLLPRPMFVEKRFFATSVANLLQAELRRKLPGFQSMVSKQ